MSETKTEGAAVSTAVIDGLWERYKPGSIVAVTGDLFAARCGDLLHIWDVLAQEVILEDGYASHDFRVYNIEGRILLEIPVCRDGNILYGLFDLSVKKWIIEPVRGRLHAHEGGKRWEVCENDNGYVSLVDVTGTEVEVLIDPSYKYNDFSFIQPGLYRAKKGNRYGVFSVIQKEQVLAPEYDDVYVGKGACVVPVKDGKQGVYCIERKRFLANGLHYSDVRFLNKDRAVLYVDDKPLGLLDIPSDTMKF